MGNNTTFDGPIVKEIVAPDDTIVLVKTGSIFWAHLNIDGSSGYFLASGPTEILALAAAVKNLKGIIAAIRKSM